MYSKNHALSLVDVSKSFASVRAVDKISLLVPPGCIYGFLGPNGAGKTTLIRMIMSIIYPDSGSLSVLGQPDAEAVKDRLGYLPEEKGLYKKMTVRGILSYFGRLKSMGAADARRKASTLLQQFGLGEWIDKKCETLSRGMSQKVQILGTIIHNPELVILDEPFSGLDPINIEAIRKVILQMKRDGRTVIFSTHIMEQAERLCDYIVLIDKGHKVLDGPLAEIKSSAGRGILLDYDGDGSFLPGVKGVTRVSDAGKQAEIFLDDSTDPQSILLQLVNRLKIRRFDLREPSLHEIFLRSVKGNRREE